MPLERLLLVALKLEGKLPNELFFAIPVRILLRDRNLLVVCPSIGYFTINATSTIRYAHWRAKAATSTAKEKDKLKCAHRNTKRNKK